MVSEPAVSSNPVLSTSLGSAPIFLPHQPLLNQPANSENLSYAVSETVLRSEIASLPVVSGNISAVVVRTGAWFNLIAPDYATRGRMPAHSLYGTAHTSTANGVSGRQTVSCSLSHVQPTSIVSITLPINTSSFVCTDIIHLGRFT